MLPAGNTQLIQITDATLLDATRRSGAWLACRPGCNSCCHGVFAISSLDAARLNEGVRQLRLSDPVRTSALATRLAVTQARLAAGFPGDITTGVLATDEDSQARFEDFANDEPCPVLDPATGTCDLYTARPMTCRIFGPPVRSADGLGTCELCFQGATVDEITAAEMHLPDPTLEAELTKPLGDWTTIVAFAFTPEIARNRSL